VAAVIQASAVTVRRGRRVVLSDVDLVIEAGQAVHLAGANGSGKTSLLRVLAGLAAPRTGTVRRPARCAFVGEKVVLTGSVTAGEWLAVMRALRGLPAADWRAAVREAGLEPSVLGLPVARHSKGMLQRLTLVEATEPGCDALLLDESFAGLDREGRERAGLDAALVVVVAAGQTAWFAGYPLVARRLGYSDVFVPPPHATDVFVAVLAHVCCAMAGGSLAVLFAPPRLARRASAAAAVMASLLAMVAVSGPLGHGHRPRADRLRELPRARDGADDRRHALGPRPRLSREPTSAAATAAGP
jgi:heme exporter protein A